MTRNFQTIGQRTVRDADRDKVTGQAPFGADVNLPNTLEGLVLRSPHAHARILAIDTSKAMRAEGVKAIVTAVSEQPEMNAHFDDEAGIITQFGGVHIGIATQTPNGLIVPVVRHAEANSLWDNAGEVQRLADAARAGTAERDELSGSTMTITSLGPLGAIATTPIINHPEVAIVGINKMTVRPWWDGQQFVPRTMMNLSCSFDHRVIDGWPAAVFVQNLKTLLEKPAMLFVES